MLVVLTTIFPEVTVAFPPTIEVVFVAVPPVSMYCACDVVTLIVPGALIVTGKKKGIVLYSFALAYLDKTVCAVISWKYL